MRIVILLSLLSICSTISFAQEATGLFSGRYSGINATKYNPAFSSRNQNQWDLQLVGAHAFFETNYTFLPTSNSIEFIRNIDNIDIPDTQGDIPLGQYDYPLIFKTSNDLSFVDIKSEVRGPGLMYALKPNLRIGVSYSERAYITGRQIPSAFNYAEISNLQSDSSYIATPFAVNALAWSEYSFHTAYLDNSNNSWGINAKILRGRSHASFSNKGTVSYTNPNDNIASIQQGADIQFSYKNDYQSLSNKGLGLAVDLGWSSAPTGYNKRQFSLALIDVGMIRFNDQTYTLNFAANQNIDLDNYQDLANDEAVLTQLRQDFITMDSTTGANYILPSAITAQYRQSFGNHFSMELNAVQRVAIHDKQLSRSNLANATFMYDRKHFSAFLPVSIYDYADLRVGAAVRLFFVTIGSDHIGSLVGSNQEYNGSDIYLNVRLYPFQSSNEISKLNKAKCYYWVNE